MRLSLWLALLIGFSCLILSTCSVQAGNWDLSTLWSNNRNPNSAWTYGCASSNLTTWQTTFDTNVSNWLSGGLQGWRSGGNSIPGIGKTVSSAPWGVDCPQVRAIMHTDNSGNLQCGAKWTAPYTMVVDLSGDVWMPRNLGRVDCVSLVVNGTVLINKVTIPSTPTNTSANPYTLASAIVAGGGSASSLQNITIQAGQSLWLVCGTYGGDTGNADFVGMDFTVTEDEQWDLTSLWSNSRNPNRTWAYGCTTTNLASWQSTFDTNAANWLGSGSSGWQSGGNSIPGISKASTTNPWSIDWPVGRVAVHTDNTGNNYPDGVQWTAPCDMTIDLSGDVWMPRNLGRLNWVSLVVDGSVLINKVQIPSYPTNTSSNPYTLASAIVDGGGSANSLSNISIQQGQKVWLVCGTVGPNTGYADFVGLDFLVTRVPTSGYHPSAVVVTPEGVTLPDGSSLNTESTTTQGLQEAITYACDYGYDLFVTPGTYTLSSALSFPALQIMTVRLMDVTLNFTSAVTGPAISFDSTMMVDVYMTGSISAPSASSAVYFHPVNLHPLDGLLLGTKGITDTRFIFDSVFANGYGVSVNTTSASIGGTFFGFNSISSTQHGSTVEFTGSGFSEQNIWDPTSSERTDDPIPFNLFHPDWVAVCPPIFSGPAATVYLPGGSTLDTTGTTTAGLQEAVDYASDNDLNLAVFGRGIINVNPYGDCGCYNLSDTLDFPAMSSKMIRFYGLTLNYTPTTGTGVVIRDMYYSDFELTGQLGTSTANVSLYIVPSTDGDGVDHSIVRVGSIATAGNFGPVLEPYYNDIHDSTFYFNEVLGAQQYGVTLNNPTANTSLYNNYVRTLHNHGFVGIGCAIGRYSTNAGRIYSNTVIDYTCPDNGYATTALDIYGSSNTLYLRALGNYLTNGAVFETGSSSNTLYYHTINATNPILDYGTSNTKTYQ